MFGTYSVFRPHMEPLPKIPRYLKYRWKLTFDGSFSGNYRGHTAYKTSTGVLSVIWTVYSSPIVLVCLASLWVTIHQHPYRIAGKTKAHISAWQLLKTNNLTQKYFCCNNDISITTTLITASTLVCTCCSPTHVVVQCWITFLSVDSQTKPAQQEGRYFS